MGAYVMRILVFSDSHGDSESIEKVLRRFSPDAAIHLGDGVDDLISLESHFPHTLFFNVQGNMDDSGDPERFQMFENVLFYMSHEKRDISGDVKLVLYGHTHVPALYINNGITYMNPGSICKDYGFRTFGLIDISDDEYSCEVKFADSMVL